MAISVDIDYQAVLPQTHERSPDSAYHDYRQAEEELVFDSRSYYPLPASKNDGADRREPTRILGSNEYDKFRDRLLDPLQAEVLEDGLSHPAELVIQELLGDISRLVRLVDLFIDDATIPATLRADALQVYSRFDEIADYSSVSIIGRALRSGDLSLREAGMRVVESQPSAEHVAILQSHNEENPWLANYSNTILAEAS